MVERSTRNPRFAEAVQDTSMVNYYSTLEAVNLITAFLRLNEGEEPNKGGKVALLAAGVQYT
jgi:hypothetical protein